MGYTLWWTRYPVGSIATCHPKNPRSDPERRATSPLHYTARGSVRRDEYFYWWDGQTMQIKFFISNIQEMSSSYCQPRLSASTSVSPFSAICSGNTEVDYIGGFAPSEDSLCQIYQMLMLLGFYITVLQPIFNMYLTVYNSINTCITKVINQFINQVPHGLTMLNLSPTSSSARQSLRTCRVFYDGPPSLRGASRRLCGNCRWPPSRAGLVVFFHIFSQVIQCFMDSKWSNFLDPIFEFFGEDPDFDGPLMGSRRWFPTIEMIKCWRLCQSAVGESENPPKLFGRHIPHLWTPPCKFLHDCVLSSATDKVCDTRKLATHEAQQSWAPSPCWRDNEFVDVCSYKANELLVASSDRML